MADRDCRPSRPNQIFDSILENELDHQLRILPVQSGQDRGQHLSANHLAGGDPHGAAHRATLGGRDPQQRRGRVAESSSAIRPQLRRSLGRCETVLRSGVEELKADGLLECVDYGVRWWAASAQATARRPEREPSCSTARKRAVKVPSPGPDYSYILV